MKDPSSTPSVFAPRVVLYHRCMLAGMTGTMAGFPVDVLGDE